VDFGGGYGLGIHGALGGCGRRLASWRASS